MGNENYYCVFLKFFERILYYFIGKNILVNLSSKKSYDINSYEITLKILSKIEPQYFKILSQNIDDESLAISSKIQPLPGYSRIIPPTKTLAFYSFTGGTDGFWWLLRPYKRFYDRNLSRPSGQPCRVLFPQPSPFFLAFWTTSKALNAAAGAIRDNNEIADGPTPGFTLGTAEDSFFTEGCKFRTRNVSIEAHTCWKMMGLGDKGCFVRLMCGIYCVKVQRGVFSKGRFRGARFHMKYRMFWMEFSQ